MLYSFTAPVIARWRCSPPSKRRIPPPLTPEERNPEQTEPLEEAPAPASNRNAAPGWFQRFSSILFIIFCFELGLFLVIYPWTDAWTENYLSLAAPATLEAGWRLVWNNSYLRGAVSGVGLANIWIALTEVFRMFSNRFAKMN